MGELARSLGHSSRSGSVEAATAPAPRPAAAHRARGDTETPKPRESNEVLLARARRGRSRPVLGYLLRQLGLLLSLSGGWTLSKRRADDAVDCTIFAPPEVGHGDHFFIQVFAHTAGQAKRAARLAVLYDKDARPRGFKSLQVEIADGAQLLFHLDLPTLVIADPIQSLRWRRRAAAVQFLVSVPADHARGDVVGNVTVSLDGVPVGYIGFKLTVTEGGRVAPRSQHPLGKVAHRFKKAFISYATEDRNEVLKRVQMLTPLRIGYFQDVLHLKPGERWERKLYRHIDKCDLFLLFWSTAAKKSEWVLEEVRYALKHKGEIIWRHLRSTL